MLQRINTTLFKQLPGSSPVFFRIAFGLILLWESIDYYQKGWIARYWIAPDFHFNYHFFEWVTPWPGNGMYIHFIVLGVASLLLTLGLFYRLAALILFLATSYVFLLDEARYLNHVYLTILLSFLLIFIPANRQLSLDAKLFPRIKRTTTPAWSIQLLRFQIGVPYFFGGIAKLNSDWLQGEPMRIWLGNNIHFPLINPLLKQDWMVYAFSYAGLAIDLFAVPLLLWKRTRVLMFVVLVLFHTLNDRFFTIGIFPWLMIAATTIFFAPDWCEQVIRKFKQTPKHATFILAGGALFTGLSFITQETIQGVPQIIMFIAGALVTAELLPAGTRSTKEHPDVTTLPKHNRFVLGLLSVWVLTQVLIPLRHYAIPGNSNWTEEGHRFAWHMLLRTKSGTVTYLITEPRSAQQDQLTPEAILPEWQASRFQDNPDMILQLAHYIAAELEKNNFPDVEVRAITLSSLNGRPPQPLIDSSVDLARVKRPVWHAPWILPLTEPLPRE